MAFGPSPIPSAGRRLGQQEFHIMKKLLIATSVAAGLAVGAVPAFAQSATTGQPGSGASADNSAAGSVQAQNYPYQAPGAYQAQAPISDPQPHVGIGAGSEYTTRQLMKMPGYFPDGTD
jgi:hypothetical protein